MSMRSKLAVCVMGAIVGWIAVFVIAYGVSLTANFVWSAIQ